MMKNRIYYTAILAIVIVLNTFFNSHPTHTALIAFIAVPVLSVAFLFISFNYAQAQQKIQSSNKKSDRLMKGGAARYTLELKNKAFLPCPYFCKVMTEDDFEYFQITGNVGSSLLPRKRAEICVDFLCTYCGKYSLNSDMIMQDYLGIVKRKYKSLDELSFTVYPRVISAKSLLNLETNSLKEQEDQDEATLTEIREYRPGDPLKSIHWKLSAKGGDLIVKEKKSSVNNDFSEILFVDTSANEGFMSFVLNTQSKIIEASVSLVNMFFENNLIFDYHDGCTANQKNSGTFNKFDCFYEMISNTDFSGNFALEGMISNFLNADSKADIWVVTGKLTLKLTNLLCAAQGMNRNVHLFIADNSDITKEKNALINLLKNNGIFVSFIGDTNQKTGGLK